MGCASIPVTADIDFRGAATWEYGRRTSCSRPPSREGIILPRRRAKILTCMSRGADIWTQPLARTSVANSTAVIKPPITITTTAGELPLRTFRHPTGRTGRGSRRRVAQPAHLEEFAGLLLDAFGSVEHHHRAVDRGQGAVGVLAEILVARRVQEVEGEPLVLEAHHRRGDRDAALALDRHPIRAHTPPLTPRLDLARQLDRPAKQQQFLGQCGLAGVRMRNDRKGAPARNLVGKDTHQSVSIIP